MIATEHTRFAYSQYCELIHVFIRNNPKTSAKIRNTTYTEKTIDELSGNYKNIVEKLKTKIISVKMEYLFSKSQTNIFRASWTFSFLLKQFIHFKQQIFYCITNSN